MIEAHEYERMQAREDGDWNDEREAAYLKSVAELNKQMEEVRKDRAKPIFVATRSVRKTSGRVHTVEFTQGKTIIDSFNERSMEAAVSRFLQYSSAYARSLTDTLFNEGNDFNRFDKRGQSMVGIISPRNFREGINRRSVRPQDDVVAEDGLTLDIDPEEKEKLVMKEPGEVIPANITGTEILEEWHMMQPPSGRMIVEEFDETEWM